MTGFTNVESSLTGKWLELLKEVPPAPSAPDSYSTQNWHLAAAHITHA